MLIKSQHNGIFERIITAKNGQLVRVQFAIVEVNGVMRGRIISATPVVSVAGAISENRQTAKTVSTSQLCLPSSVQRDISAAVEKIFTKEIPSPYVSFEFFMSQPTRAPSLFI